MNKIKLNLAGKTALITGSSRGIGFAIASALHAEGCFVILNSRNESELDDATAKLPGSLGVVGDVSVFEDAQRIMWNTLKQVKNLDILVCNVGSGKSVPPGQESIQEWRRIFELNLWSATNMIEAAKESLVSSKGVVVCVSSICGVEVIPGAPITYSSAKAALNAYVKGVSRPLGRLGVRINAVAPGNILFEGSVWEDKLLNCDESVRAILEKDVSLGRLGHVNDVTNLVLFLASSLSSFATGQIWTVDGGQTRN